MRSILLILALAGCGDFVHGDHVLGDGILVRAHFHPVPASTGQVPGGLPPPTFVRQADGRVLYSDPEGCNCVYEGTEADLRAVAPQEKVVQR